MSELAPQSQTKQSADSRPNNTAAALKLCERVPAAAYILHSVQSRHCTDAASTHQRGAGSMQLVRKEAEGF